MPLIIANNGISAYTCPKLQVMKSQSIVTEVKIRYKVFTCIKDLYGVIIFEMSPAVDRIEKVIRLVVNDDREISLKEFKEQVIGIKSWPKIAEINFYHCRLAG